MIVMAGVAVLFFMVAGPLSLVITIPMLVFAALHRAQGAAGATTDASRFKPKREWKFEYDPETGERRVVRKG
jgi:hypothetical protein